MRRSPFTQLLALLAGCTVGMGRRSSWVSDTRTFTSMARRLMIQHQAIDVLKRQRVADARKSAAAIPVEVCAQLARSGLMRQALCNFRRQDGLELFSASAFSLPIAEHISAPFLIFFVIDHFLQYPRRFPDHIDFAFGRRSPESTSKRKNACTTQFQLRGERRGTRKAFPAEWQRDLRPDPITVGNVSALPSTGGRSATNRRISASSGRRSILSLRRPHRNGPGRSESPFDYHDSII